VQTSIIEILVTSYPLNITRVYQHIIATCKNSNNPKTVITQYANEYADRLNIMADYGVHFHVGKFIEDSTKINFYYYNINQQIIKDFVIEWTINNKLKRFIIDPFTQIHNTINSLTIIGNDDNPVIAELNVNIFLQELRTLVLNATQNNLTDMLFPYATSFIKYLVITQIVFLRSILLDYKEHGNNINNTKLNQLYQITGMSLDEFLTYVDKHKTQ